MDCIYTGTVFLGLEQRFNKTLLKLVLFIVLNCSCFSNLILNCSPLQFCLES